MNKQFLTDGTNRWFDLDAAEKYEGKTFDNWKTDLYMTNTGDVVQHLCITGDWICLCSEEKVAEWLRVHGYQIDVSGMPMTLCLPYKEVPK